MNKENNTPAYNENDDVYASVDLAGELPKEGANKSLI